MKYLKYKNNKKIIFNIFILFLLLIIILFYFLIKKKCIEPFNNRVPNIYTDYIIKELNNITYNPSAPLGASENNNEIKIYIISMKPPERLLHIKNQQQKIKEKMYIFDAVKGDDLILEKLLNENFLHPSFEGKDLSMNEQKHRMREIGCYLSHMLIYAYIKKFQSKNNYTIIFEDDFNIVIDNFIQKIKSSLEIFNKLNIDFDILFLGNTPKNRGKNLKDDIYYVNHNRNLWGTHAYLINNKNIDKIIKYTKIIDKPIDIKLQYLDKQKNLNIFVFYPTIVNPNKELPSTILVLGNP